MELFFFQNILRIILAFIYWLVFSYFVCPSSVYRNCFSLSCPNDLSWPQMLMFVVTMPKKALRSRQVAIFRWFTTFFLNVKSINKARNIFSENIFLALKSALKGKQLSKSNGGLKASFFSAVKNWIASLASCGLNFSR